MTTPTIADLGVLYGGHDRLLRVAAVAEQLGVSTATVYKLCASGALPHVRIVASIRVRPADLATFIAGRILTQEPAGSRSDGGRPSAHGAASPGDLQSSSSSQGLK